jgi:hypothetical protein
MTALIEALRTPEERFVKLPNYTPSGRITSSI